MKIKLHKFEVGEVPKASDFNAMVNAIELLANFVVAEGSGLEFSESAGVRVLNYRPVISGPRYAVVTTQIEAYNTSLNKAGFGYAQIRERGEDGVFTNVGGPVKVWNDLGVLTVGKRIKIVEMQDGDYAVFTANCS